MKKLILLAFMMTLPALANAVAVKNNEIVAQYQELCAKEQDPVKRHNYCYMMENHTRAHTSSNVFRLEKAIV